MKQMVRIVFCVILCQIELINGRSTTPSVDSASYGDSFRSSLEQTETISSKSSKFADIAAKITDVINKIQQDDESVNTFRSLLSDIDETYNAFHEIDIEMSESPLRGQMLKQLEPIFQVTRSIPNSSKCRESHTFVDEGIEVSALNEYIVEFWNAKKQIDKVPMKNRLAETELLRMNRTLTDLQDQNTAEGVSMDNYIRVLVNRDHNDLPTLCTLRDWTVMYASKFIFVLDLQSYTADSFYAKGDLDKYNEYFDTVSSNFRIAKESLVGGGLRSPLIPEILGAMKDFERRFSKEPSRKPEVEFVSKVLVQLDRLKSVIENTELPLITDVPDSLAGKPDFEDEPIKTPIGRWIDGSNVSYAVLYRQNEMYSKLGEWMDPFIVSGEANPVLRLSVHPKRYDRLVFRRFNNEKAQLVGVLEDKYQTEFRDINRDLFEAAASFNKNSVNDANILITNGANINAIFEGGRRAIHAAAQSDNVILARKFFIGANNTGNNSVTVQALNARDHKGYTPLHIASKAGNRRFVELLRVAGADVNAKLYHTQSTPLHIASGKGFVSTVNALLKSNDIDVNAREMGGFTPLHRAVSGGIPVLKLLMADQRIDLHATSDKQISPLHLAIIDEYPDIVNVLLANKNVQTNSTNSLALTIASMMDNSDILQLLVDNLAISENYAAPCKWSPLHFSVALGNKRAIDTLITKRANVNAKATGNITPLHIAVVTNQKDVVELLVKEGANTQEITESGLNPLQLALTNDYNEIFNVFVDSGADLQAKSLNGLSLLHYALENNKPYIIQALVNKGVETNARINKETGETPLHTATRMAHLAVVTSLLDNGAASNSTDKHGKTPLHYAALYLNDTDILELLLSRGSDANATTSLGETPLHYAVKLGHSSQIESLVRKKADLNAADYLGVTPLHIATDNGAETIVNYLIGHGANVNASNIDGQSPLHLAVRNQHYGIAQILLNNKASVDMSDISYRTPLHIAVEHGNLSLFTLLQSHGAVLLNLSFNESHDDQIAKSPLNLAVLMGHLDIIKQAHNAINLESLDTKAKQVLLETASAVGRWDVVKYLHEIIRYTNDDIASSWCVAARYNHKLTNLISLQPPRRDRRTRYYNYEYELILGSQPICCVKDIESLESLITIGIRINGNCNGKSLINNAIIHGSHLDVVKFLVEQGATITYSADSYSDSALWAAVKSGRSDIVRYLVSRGVDVNKQSSEGKTLLHIVIAVSAPAASLVGVKSLVENGARVTMMTSDGQTPLSIAVENDQVEVVNYLLECGAKLGSFSKKPIVDYIVKNLSMLKALEDNCTEYPTIVSGATPILHAIDVGSSEVVKYLLTKESNTNVTDTNGLTLLHLAVCWLDVVKILLEKGANLHSKTKDGTTPLHASIARNCHDTEVIKYLISKGADVNSVDFQGRTPLHLVGCSMEKVKLLVESGADVNARTFNGTTVLQATVSHCDDIELVKYLIDGGADVNRADLEGRTPLHLVQNCNANVIRALVENGANVNSTTINGTTPLHAVVKLSYNAEGVNYIISKGADVNTVDSEGQTPLHLMNSVAVAQSLVNSGAQQNVENIHGLTPLLNCFISYCKEDLVKFLVHVGASVSVSDAKGLTPLHYAVKGYSMNLIETIVERGAAVNFKAVKGETPLHMAVLRGDLTIIVYLVSKNAHINEVDSTGNTPVFYAIRRGDMDVVKYLVDNGANLTIRNKYNESYQLLIPSSFPQYWEDHDPRKEVNFLRGKLNI